MQYEEFVKQIVNEVSDHIDSGINVMVKPFRRNNDFSSDGLNIVRDTNIFSPTVFLDECYDDYLRGKEINSIVSDITDFYNDHDKFEKLDVSYFYDFNEASAFLAFKLINFERNKEMLQEVPYEPYLDLAIVGYCLINHPVFGIGSILVKNAHLSYWGISKEYFFDVVKNNAFRIQPVEIKTAKEAFNHIVESEDMPNMYIISNEMSYYGAASILSPKALEDVAIRENNDLFILPSSVDEVIVVPADDMSRIEKLRSMVTDINRYYVTKENFLSNNVYIYYKSDKNVVIA